MLPNNLNNHGRPRFYIRIKVSLLHITNPSLSFHDNKFTISRRDSKKNHEKICGVKINAYFCTVDKRIDDANGDLV